MSQLHKPRETDYYLRMPTGLVFVQVSLSLSLHTLCSLSRWRCWPSETQRIVVRAKCQVDLCQHIFSLLSLSSACVCVFSPQNKCKSSSSVYRVCTAKPITTYECTVSGITALVPFITSANLDISVRWLFTQSMREGDIFLSWIQTQVFSFNIICGHFNY